MAKDQEHSYHKAQFLGAIYLSFMKIFDRGKTQSKTKTHWQWYESSGKNTVLPHSVICYTH